ncbi:hypothetical protein [Nannocystis pusilla]|uniref:hypothetical protein n=1 Tax=Nannocystis pusilla TaxID=889268 RepID=UPI003B7EAD94
MSSLPLYLRRLTTIPFADVGAAWTERLSREALRWSLGMSLVFSFRIGYRDTIDLFFTYAHGFAERGDVNTSGR